VKLERLSRDWDELAEEDALWAVLADPGQRGRWQVDDFFATGKREIDSILVACSRLGRPRRFERALDFGCGVGRLTRALARHFRECVGVDISAEMVRKALELNAGCENCAFLLNVDPNLSQFESGSFDLVYSSKVLQHLPNKRLVRAYVSELVRLVKPGGLAVFQLWTSIPVRNRLQPRRRAYALLRAVRVPQSRLSTLGLSPMGRGIAVSERQIREIVEAAGGRIVQTEPDGEWGLFYFVEAIPTRSSQAASSSGRGRRD
jgi:SAM-dependent methyltransferase